MNSTKQKKSLPSRKPKETVVDAPLLASDQTLSLKTRRFLSIAIAVHLFLILVCMAANLAPSYSEQVVQRLSAPYLVLTNQGLGMVPVELGHGTDFEGPFVFETGKGDENATEWTLFESRFGLNESPRLLHRVGRALMHLGNSQEDEHLATWMTAIATHCVKSMPASDTPDHLRFSRKRIPTYQEFGSALYQNQPLDFGMETLYQAQIIALSDQEITLVPQTDASRRSKVVDPAETR